MDRTPSPADDTPLSPGEYAAVRAAVSAGAGCWADGRPCTLNGLLERWRSVVTELEEGYPWGAPELGNDLWCRGALARVWPLLPPRVRSVRRAELWETDRRFRAATIPWPGRGEEEAGEWWRGRLPRLLEIEAGDRRERGWPSGWAMLPFPRPDAVRVID